MTELPKALSEQQRRKLVHYSQETGPVALALIDAQAELLAEYAAQAVADGMRIAELERQRDNALAREDSEIVRAAAAEARIAELERELGSAQRFGNAQESRCRDLDAAADVARDQALDKLAAANALLVEWLASRYVNKGGRAERVKRTRAHLADQPAAPARAEAADCVFVNSGDRRARSLDPWCVAHERSAICCAREPHNQHGARAEAEHWTDKRNSPAAPARTEAEQDERLVVDLQIATEAELRAELARRGLK
jgi:hypothetical protein